MTFIDHWFPAIDLQKEEKSEGLVVHNPKSNPCFDEDFCLTCPAKKWCDLEGYDEFCKKEDKVKKCREGEKGIILACIDCSSRKVSIESILNGGNGC